jgi:riboflavin kinase/FMN adenylyltransferase
LSLAWFKTSHRLPWSKASDFRFGRARAGDIATLRELGKRHGFAVHVVDPRSVVLTDQTTTIASSSLVRWLVEHGRARDAWAVLGRPYEIAGTVIQGDRRGRTIGFPTANVDSECLSPADGVYSGVALLPDQRKLAAAISVGTKPTFGPGARAVEAFLLDAPRAESAILGLPEYGWAIRVEFHHWLRDQVRFSSLPELLEQMDRDCKRVRELQTFKEEPACR